MKLKKKKKKKKRKEKREEEKKRRREEEKKEKPVVPAMVPHAGCRCKSLKQKKFVAPKPGRRDPREARSGYHALSPEARHELSSDRVGDPRLGRRWHHGHPRRALAATLVFAWGARADFLPAFRAYRQNLGRAILLGLEFLVGADIVGTVAVHPTFRSVGVLGLIVLIRTFLSFTLEMEITGRLPWRRGTAEEPSPR